MSDQSLDVEEIRSAVTTEETPASTRLSDLALDERGVEERVARGESNTVESQVSRTVEEILRANVLTRFNMLVGSLVVVILFIGPIQDALFGLVMVFNSAVGIVQELRAKRALDALALVAVPQVRVLRSRGELDVKPEEVVIDDLIIVKRGDQIVVDAVVIKAEGLEVDESLLTGESDPRPKSSGDECLSGAAVVAGAGVIQATKVGERAYAAGITREARRFSLVDSELRSGTNQILRWIGWAIAPTAVILIWSQIRAAESLAGAARGAVAGTIGMIPQGLVLMISIAMAVGVARLARNQVLTQELAALEGLARVDVLCFDKTGTITDGRLTLRDVIPIQYDIEPLPALAAIAHTAADPNATLRAVMSSLPRPDGWTPTKRVAFRSDRRWSAAEFSGEGTWVLGAPEAVTGSDPSIAAMVSEHTGAGHRVLLLAHSASPLGDELPTALRTEAIVVLGDSVRGDASETVGYFADQGIALKVISGDHPATVAAVSKETGISGSVTDGPSLPTDPVALRAAAERHAVFGRVAPDQKRSIIRALQSRGHVVAMVGDGVNDVLALKAADVGVAMGNGSAAARAVSPLILVDGRFSRMPNIVSEGRRVIGNIERVAGLYLTKTVYALLLAWSVGVLGWAFPLLPRHYTVIGAATIGIPSFWLALEPTHSRARSGFVKRVLRFGVPVGTLAALAGFSAFWTARAESVSLADAQSLTTMTLVAVGLGVLLLVARPLTPARKLIAALVGIGSILVFLVPDLRTFYALSLPRPAIVLAAVGIIAITGAVMYATLRASGWWRELPAAIRQLEELAGVKRNTKDH